MLQDILGSFRARIQWLLECCDRASLRQEWHFKHKKHKLNFGNRMSVSHRNLSLCIHVSSMIDSFTLKSPDVEGGLEEKYYFGPFSWISKHRVD